MVRSQQLAAARQVQLALGCSQGYRVVAAQAGPFGHGRRHPRSHYQVLEHYQAEEPQVDRDRELGLQSDVREKCQRARVHPRIQPEPDKCLALPVDEEDCDIDWSLVPCPLPGCQPRRANPGDGRRRRDAPILERVPTEEAASDSLNCHAELRRSQMMMIKETTTTTT